MALGSAFVMYMCLSRTLAAEELRSFTTEASAKTQKSWKDVYSRRIQENEHLTPKLHAEQQQLKTSLGSRKRQLQLFDDLKRFLELKMAHNAATLKQQLSAKGPTAQQTVSILLCSQFDGQLMPFRMIVSFCRL